MKTGKEIQQKHFKFKCKANREIEIVESATGIPCQYLAIEKVEGVGIFPPTFVGESNSETKEKIKGCNRCVVPYHKKCDLSDKTITDLSPQLVLKRVE